MAGYRHYLPTRAYILAAVREYGARFVYGDEWPRSDAETIASLESLTDAEYMTQGGCDHHDEAGNCLGHDDGRKGL